MSRFTKIAQDVFNDLQFEAGVLLWDFDPSSPTFADADIVCATTGDITITYKPTYGDFFEDINNAPTNVMEGMYKSGDECSIAFTALNLTKELIKLGIGTADISGNKVTPRQELKLTDFASELWWVGDKLDGGFGAVCLKNALSSDGLTITTTKKGKGKIGITIKGYTSIAQQDAVPMDFYVIDGEVNP